MKSIGKVYLSADVNRTGEPYLEILRSGGCVHVNAYHKQNAKGDLLEYVNFQLTDGAFKKWAETFSLMASEL